MDESHSKNEVVVLSGTGQEVSFQLFQDIYSSLTGRQEKLDRNYFDRHHLRLNDFINLHSQLAQLIEQYQCKMSQCSVVVRYSDGRSESFSSFDRFKLQIGTRNECVENVELSYEFLIVLPKTKEPRTYKVDIFALSHIGVKERLEQRDASEVERRVNEDFTKISTRVEINYTDI